MELQTSINTAMKQITQRNKKMVLYLIDWSLLDWTMFCCVLLISILIILEQLDGSLPFAVLIMMGYLVYLFVYKFNQKKPNYQIKTLQKLSMPSNNSYRNLSQENQSSAGEQEQISVSDLQSKSLKRSSFFTEFPEFIKGNDSYFSQASFDKSGMSENAKSMISYRSRTSKRQQVRKDDKDLFDIFKQKKISESGVEGRKNDDYFIEIKEKQMHQKVEIDKKNLQMREKFDRPFLNTLKEHMIERSQLEKNYLKISGICKKVVNQFFEENLQNLGQIVGTVQKMYLLRVQCSVIPYLRLRYIPTFEKSSLFTNEPKQRQLYLSDVLQQLLTSKTSKLSLPHRTTHERSTHRMKQAQYIEYLQKQLVKHLERRQQMDEWMHIPYKPSIEPEQIIERLSALQGYLQRKSDRYARYNCDDDSICLQEEVVFNVVRKKINSVINKKQLQLCFEREYLFGFLRKADSRIRIVKQVRPIGNQYHYNIEETTLSKRKNVYNCELGQNNTICAIYFYLFILRKQESLWNNHSFVELVGSTLF